MKLFYSYFVLMFCIFLTHTSYASPAEDACLLRASSIEEKLSCLEGVTYKVSYHNEEKKFFSIDFTQAIDHTRPQDGSFQQHLVLIHRSEERPMVLQTSGYSIFGAADTNISRLFKTNQLQVEHRYFSSSTPSVVDWTKLNIKQSADDFHKITLKFKKIYGKAWVNTGASKGGMTSVYHRRFYPDDLVGTVADVAPLSFHTADERYAEFLENVGGDTYKDCREDLKNLQVSLLKNKAALTDPIQGDFSQLGGKEIAYEHSVIEMPFFFWQYGNPDAPTGCTRIPPVNADLEEQFKFLQSTAAIRNYTDSAHQRYQTYYYQAATELGSPANPIAHLEIYRDYDFSIDQYAPKGVTYSYSNAAMHDISKWVRQEAKDIIFIYGEFDPWTAAEFSVDGSDPSVKKFYVSKGNHSANFTQLRSKDRSEVISTISKWLGIKPVSSLKELTETPSLEELEFMAKKRGQLP